VPTAKGKDEGKEEAAATQESSEGGEQEFSRERWLAESEAIIGQPAHVVAGALHSVPESKESLTVDEMQAAVDEFLATPINPETPPEA
jgi:hypothetical protein